MEVSWVSRFNVPRDALMSHGVSIEKFYLKITISMDKCITSSKLSSLTFSFYILPPFKWNVYIKPVFRREIQRNVNISLDRREYKATVSVLYLTIKWDFKKHDWDFSTNFRRIFLFLITFISVPLEFFQFFFT